MTLGEKAERASVCFTLENNK